MLVQLGLRRPALDHQSHPIAALELLDSGKTLLACGRCDFIRLFSQYAGKDQLTLRADQIA